MKVVKCPICGAEIELYESPDEGDVLYCQECGRELEVVSTHPIKLEPLIMDEDLNDEFEDFLD